MYVFDTDHLSVLQRDEPGAGAALRSRLAAHDEAVFQVTIVSFHEQVLGWHNYLVGSTRDEQLGFGYTRFEQLLRAFNDYQILSFDESATDVYRDLSKQRVRVGKMDLRIASIAIANGMTLLTRNTIDFERVPGLAFEDWTSA